MFATQGQATRGQAEKQGSLFGFAEVSIDHDFSELRRDQLDAEAWLDYCPMWLSGDETLLDSLIERAEWRQPVVQMYDREVLTPRLVANVDPGIHPVLPEIVDTLSRRIARERQSAVVATISLGGARRFLIRPKEGGATHSFSLGHGDLVVMGGSCQRTWEHAVPKVASAEPRIALMFRHVYD